MELGKLAITSAKLSNDLFLLVKAERFIEQIYEYETNNAFQGLRHLNSFCHCGIGYLVCCRYKHNV